MPVYEFFRGRDGEGAGQVGRAPILFYLVEDLFVSASVVLFSVTIKCSNVFICFYLFVPILLLKIKIIRHRRILPSSFSDHCN